MSKGKNGNKEVKKPKALKPVVAEALVVPGLARPAAPAQPKPKKR